MGKYNHNITTNITTIYKSKGSRLSLESDRGIFVLSVLKRIIDKLIYNDMYEHIDINMSDSNIGGRRNKNIKNHLFIVHGIINAVVNKSSPPVASDPASLKEHKNQKMKLIRRPLY